MLVIELHAHTHASGDCLTRPADVVKTCRAKGIDRLAVTDHNTIRGALEAHALAPDGVIVGEEVMTTQGELLAYFVKEEVPPGLTPQETIARLRGQGAAISVSHPFDRHRKGAWRQSDLLAILPLVDAIEVFNARCMHAEDNTRALAFAREHGALGTVGSDAHSRMELGRAVLRVPEFSDAAGMVAGWRDALPLTRLSSPLIHFTSRYASLYKRLTGQRPKGAAPDLSA